MAAFRLAISANFSSLIQAKEAAQAAEVKAAKEAALRAPPRQETTVAPEDSSAAVAPPSEAADVGALAVLVRWLSFRAQCEPHRASEVLQQGPFESLAGLLRHPELSAFLSFSLLSVGGDA